VFARQDLGEAGAGVVGLANGAREHAVDGQDAAQRLEGAEAEALALVLDADLGQAQPRGQRRQGMERRRHMPGALLQLLAELGNAVGIDHELLVAAEFQGLRGTGILGQPGSNHGPSHSMAGRLQIA